MITQERAEEIKETNRHQKIWIKFGNLQAQECYIFDYDIRFMNLYYETKKEADKEDN